MSAQNAIDEALIYTVNVKESEAVLFHPLTLHRSVAQNTQTINMRPRYSIDIRYFDKNLFSFSVIFNVLGLEKWIIKQFLTIFNEYFRPSTNKNHTCGTKFLVKRSEDNEKTILYRFQAYLDKTLPILDFYKKLNLLHQINGRPEIDQIFKEICAIMGFFETWLYKPYLYK